MLDTFRKTWDLLDTRERRNAVVLFGMVVIMGLLETIGVASIMPFITVLSNPEVIHEKDYLAAVYDGLGFASTQKFLIFLGTATFMLVVGSLVFKAFTQWAMARYVHMRNYTLGSRVLRGYLERPYSFFLNRHSSDLGKKVLAEVAQVIGSCLKPGVDLVANTVVAILLVGLVVAVNPVVALSAVVVLGGAYTVIYTFLRKRISRMGMQRVEANQKRFQVVQEALGGIKDVKVLGVEDGYIRSFCKPAQRFARSKANAQVISQIPQFALQAMVFGGMLVILLGLLAVEGNDLSTVLPVMALYGFAASRLIPALQNIYKSITSMRFGKPALDLLHADCVQTGLIAPPTESFLVDNKRARGEALPLEHRLDLDSVSYAYPYAGKSAVKNVSLSIQAKTTVGFVGSTGAGKTTVVDIILGLLEPQQGRMLVDGAVLDSNRIPVWQQNIGYVPQHIFITDDTVAANIAFGVRAKDIDQDAVERAARIAELHQFVSEEMPHGYDTMVGDRGVRLSGGQRQRIGIARALYRDPDVLVLDEATSALDTLTEGVVMDAVHNLDNRKTIIIIAHRLSTVRECHTIFLLEHGCLVATGSYDELRSTNRQFESMVIS